jgi:hypothetical protein
MGQSAGGKLRKMIEIDSMIDGGGASYAEVATYMDQWPEYYADRLQDLLTLRPVMARGDWLRLLGEYWSSLGDVHVLLPELRAAFAGESLPAREMMTDEELAELAALPEEIIVYRGCGPGNAESICWALDLDVAMRFPLKDRDQGADNLIITGTVARSRVVALKRYIGGETEVISFDVQELDREEWRAEV